jgi:hypothetical protein
MSIEAEAWVWRESPYKGAAFIVHVRLANIANEDHGNELWMHRDKVAATCRLSFRQVTRIMAQMVDDGYLELLDAGGGRGKIARYRLIVKPGHPVHVSPEKVDNDDTKHGQRRHPHLLPHEVDKKGADARGDDAHDPLYGFDHFWEMYPKRNERRIGRGVCERRWVKMTLDDKRAAYRGARNYRADVDAQRTIAKDPDRWLRDRLWEDWQVNVEPVESTAATVNRPEVAFDPDAPNRFQ